MSNEYPHVAISGRVRLGVLVVAVVAVLIAAQGIIGRMHHDHQLVHAAELKDTSTVKTVTPQPTPSTQSLELPGNVSPYVEAQIYSRVNGYLKTWYTDIGAHVKKGQLLAVIETPELDQQIAHAQSELMVAKANLELANITAQRGRN